MISYFVTFSASETIRNYLYGPGRSLAHLVDVISYDDLADRTEVPAGAAIFTALDQVSPLQREILPRVRDQLLASGFSVLNDPGHVLLRYPLLRMLHAAGRNAFTVHRAADAALVSRFPVFLRDEHLHNGNLTPLLHTQAELQAALRGLMLRGRRVSELLIVEFCDTSVGGVFRKYSAFKVGEAIIPRYLQVSRSWMIKTGTRVADPDALAEDREYLETNPHEAWLRQTFARAGIDYGRIDYGMLDGRPQVWEINTNPALGCSPPRPHAYQHDGDRVELDRLKAIFHDRFAAALRTLALERHGGPPARIELAPAVRTSLRAGARRARRQERLAQCVSQLVESPLVQAAKPWLKRATLGLAPVISHIPRRP